MASFDEQTPDIGILLPKIYNWEKTYERYGGLVSELISRDIEVSLLESHASYQGGGVFADARIPYSAELGSMTSVPTEGLVLPLLIRDLTMPGSDTMPLYEDLAAPRIVHTPAINSFFRSKSNVYELMPDLQPITIPRVKAVDVGEAIAEITGSQVVVKPDTGSASEGVLIGSKKDVTAAFLDSKQDGIFVVQEAIDMSSGLPERGIKGAHNLRFIVIGGTAIFGFIRDDGGKSLTLASESETFSNRTFLLPEDYTVGFQTMLKDAQSALNGLKGGDKTVLAIDLMRGINAAGDEREYVLEVNRRPLRNSPYDGRDVGTLWASHQWDVAEATMLANIVKVKG